MLLSSDGCATHSGPETVGACCRYVLRSVTLNHFISVVHVGDHLGLDTKILALFHVSAMANLLTIHDTLTEYMQHLVVQNFLRHTTVSIVFN